MEEISPQLGAFLALYQEVTKQILAKRNWWINNREALVRLQIINEGALE